MGTHADLLPEGLAADRSSSALVHQGVLYPISLAT